MLGKYDGEMPDELGRLERIDVREEWESESQNFTPWLAKDENLSILADTLGMDLEVEAQEANVGQFRADILCKNAEDGSWVLIENQLERTDHKHLGQILTYAAGLHAVTICWVAKTFTEEHRAALDWLNEISGDRFQFFGFEVELWRIGNSARAPKFNIVSRPNDWTRSVGPAPSNETPTKRQQREFWSALKTQLEESKSRVRATKPLAQHWMNFSLGKTGFKLVGLLNTKEKWIGVELYLRPPHAKEHFELLKQKRGEIERSLGKLDWQPLPNKKSSRVRLHQKADPLQQGGWPDQIDWMVKKLEAFDKTLRPLVKDLDASASSPDDDEVED